MLKHLKTIYFILISIFFLTSCATIKEGFTSQKKNSTDEFLVEKKSPLVMPPEFNKLPLPDTMQNETKSLNENKIKNIIKKTEVSKDDDLIDQNTSFENSILEKIKNNQ